MLSFLNIQKPIFLMKMMSFKNIMTFMSLPRKESHFRVRKGLQQKVIRWRQCTTVWYARQVEDVDLDVNAVRNAVLLYRTPLTFNRIPKIRFLRKIVFKQCVRRDSVTLINY